MHCISFFLSFLLIIWYHSLLVDKNKEILLYCPGGQTTFLSLNVSASSEEWHNTLLSKCSKPPFNSKAILGWLRRDDGCSIFGHKIASKILGHACSIHDLCYSWPMRNKDDCDNEFIANIKAIGSEWGIILNLVVKIINNYLPKSDDSWFGYCAGQRWATLDTVNESLKIQCSSKLSSDKLSKIFDNSLHQ